MMSTQSNRLVLFEPLTMTFVYFSISRDITPIYLINLEKQARSSGFLYIYTVHL